MSHGHNILVVVQFVPRHNFFSLHFNVYKRFTPKNPQIILRWVSHISIWNDRHSIAECERWFLMYAIYCSANFRYLLLRPVCCNSTPSSSVMVFFYFVRKQYVLKSAETGASMLQTRHTFKLSSSEVYRY